MNKEVLQLEYERLCKELGHLEYHKDVIEQKIEDIKNLIKGIDKLMPLMKGEDERGQ